MRYPTSRSSTRQSAPPLVVLAVLLAGESQAFLQSGTLLTHAASATFMGGSLSSSVTYSATSHVVVINPAVYIWKRATPTVVGVAGGIVTYTICFSNAGSNSAFSVTTTDKWPNNTTFNSAVGVYSAWASGGGANQPLTSWTTSVIAGPWTAGLPPNGQSGTGAFHWVIPMMGVGYSGCITYALNIQ